MDDLLGRQAKLARSRTINVQLQGRVIDVLRDQHVADARQSAHLLRDFNRRAVGRLQVGTIYLNIDGGRQTEVQNRINQPAGLKIGAQLGQLVLQAAAHAVHVFVTAEAVLLIQADL